MLLDALPAEQRADDEPRPEEAETQVIDEADRAETEVIATEVTEPEVIKPEPRPDRTVSVRTPVSARVHGDQIDIVCAPATEVPAVDGPATADVDGDAGTGFTLQARLGSDAAVLLPSAIDLDLSAHGADFSLIGIDGTVSGDLHVGNVLIEGLFVDGISRIKANAGEVQLRLQAGSDVEVISQCPATVYAEGLEHTGRGRWSLGDGTAKFEITGNLGSITVTAL